MRIVLLTMWGAVKVREGQLSQPGGHWVMMFGQARSRSVLMGLDNHMITGSVPALLPGELPAPHPDMRSRHM